VPVKIQDLRGRELFRVSPSKTGHWIELNSWWGLRSPLWKAARPEFELRARAMCRPCAQRPARRSLVS